MRKKVLTAVGLVAVALALGTGPASGIGQPGAGNSESAPGRAKASENCSNVIDRQDSPQKNLWGSETGSANDEKQANRSVTNCDHYWDSAGSNP